MKDFVLDTPRPERIGFGEAVFCSGKSAVQIDAILADPAAQGGLLLTRLDPEKYAALAAGGTLDYDPLSRTAFAGPPRPTSSATTSIGIVTAGTSDIGVALEASRTLQFDGHEPGFIADIGVAGLWRLMRRVEELRALKIIIVVAGMDAALPTVLGGLVPGCIIAVPTSVGYGVATGGRAALDAMLASCAPGVTVVNIDNGYGAACAAMRIARAMQTQA